MQEHILDADYNEREGITLEQEAIGFLRTASAWAKLIAIVGFIFSGLMVFGGVSSAAVFWSGFGEMITQGNHKLLWFYKFVPLVCIGMGVVYFYGMLYLFNFSGGIERAARGNNQKQLTRAFKNLKEHYKFLGVMSILFFVLYAFFMVLMFRTNIYSLLG